MNTRVKKGGYVVRKQLYPGNHVYFVMNGLPHTGIITATGIDRYEVSDVTGMFMSWDSRCMTVDKTLCVGTQEIYIPEFPDKETASWLKSMGATMLKYENFPKKQIMKYESMGSIFTQMIEFIPGDMIFQLTNGKLYELVHHKDYGELLIGTTDIVVPLWVYHSHKCDIEKLINARKEAKLPLPKIATEYQVSKIFCDDGVCKEMRKQHIREFESGYKDTIASRYKDIQKRHMQLLYKKENMKKRNITEKEVLEKLSDKLPSKYNLEKILLPLQS